MTLHVYRFVTRHKDNKHIQNHVARELTILGTDDEYALNKFENFVNDGPKGELCRLYRTINPRDNIKINRELTHFLIDHPEYTSEKLSNKITQIAFRSSNRAESKWLFDFDSSDTVQLEAFKTDILDIDDSVEINVHPTVSGYAVIVSHGFYSENLLEKYPYVELKKDDMLLLTYQSNN